MRVFIISLSLASVIAVQGFAIHDTYLPAESTAEAVNLVGRWRVKFTLTGGAEKNLIFDSQTKGTGYFHLLDTGPDSRPVPNPLPAAWSQLTNDRVSFSGEAELPIGTCCREMGTLIFKGKFASSNSISGKLIFVTSVDEEESPYKFRSMVGTFTATRVPAK
ncbi:MAG TPA: hypothetical protein VIF64_21815 [Pyrinomonadaceae bacterium]